MCRPGADTGVRPDVERRRDRGGTRKRHTPKALLNRRPKPSNIMVREDGTVKVMDFGLAKRGRGAFGRTRSVAADD